MTINLMSISVSRTQIKISKNETVIILGNCEMCEKNIEKAGNLNECYLVNWDVDTKIATLKYDSTKTNQEEILRHIAVAGYESELYLPSNVSDYQLSKCCQYEKGVKTDKTKEEHKVKPKPCCNKFINLEDN